MDRARGQLRGSHPKTLHNEPLQMPLLRTVVNIPKKEEVVNKKSKQKLLTQ
jgi:hypothetical protein